MRRLFMRDSESPRTLRQLGMLVGLILAALLLSDWLLGRILPYLTTEPPFILRPVNVAGVEALWRANEAGIQPVVFTGSSQVYTGVSPHQFDDRIKMVSGQGVQAVNVSILGAVVPIQRDLIRNLFIPNHAQVILYGIEMRAFKTESLRDDYFLLEDFRNKSLGYAVTYAAPTERAIMLWLLQHSNWARYRDNINEWLSGERAINQQINLSDGTADDRGFAPFPNTSSLNTTNISTQFIPFSVTDEARQLLSNIRSDCEQSGVPCILLNMPIHYEAYTLISEAEEAQYRQLIEAAGLPIWDFNTIACRTVLGDTAFFNVNHLNANGAGVFSRLIADVYANVFYDVPIEGDAACATIIP